MIKIKVKYFDEICELKKITQGDWIDLKSRDDIFIRKGESYLIHLGVAMQLPKGYEAIVAMRSSSFKKYGVIQTNAIGIIDEVYCGDDDEWLLPVYATRDCHIPYGERICQFRILRHQPPLEFDEVLELKNSNRGGFGSTDGK